MTDDKITRDDVTVFSMKASDCEADGCGEPAAHEIFLKIRCINQVVSVGCYCDRCVGVCADAVRDALTW